MQKFAFYISEVSYNIYVIGTAFSTPFPLSLHL